MFLKDQPKLRPLSPVVSSVIYDKKSHSDLQILEISDDSSPVEGNNRSVLFLERTSVQEKTCDHLAYSTVGGKQFNEFGLR